MRIKIIGLLIGVGYAGIVTKVAINQHNRIVLLNEKLKKQKRKTKKYKKIVERPFYKRTALPRNGKAVPKIPPKNPIGFC